MALTINTNISWRHELSDIGKASMTASFFDTTTVEAGEDAPTNWLWDFGDGHQSIEQNPVHTYYGRFRQGDQEFSSATHNIEYTVTLTAWSGGTFKNFLTYTPTTTSRYRGAHRDGIGTVPQVIVAARSEDHFSLWGSTPHSSMQYEISELSGGSYDMLYIDRLLDLSAHSVDTFVGYGVFEINTRWFGESYYADVLGDPSYDHPFSVRTGRWNEVTNDWYDHTDPTFYQPKEYDVKQIHLLEMSPIVGHVSIDFSKFAGESDVVIRMVDGWEYQKDVQNYGLSGYLLYSEALNPFIWQGITPKNKGVLSKVITAGSLIIQRPDVFTSGIREAYFSDGWEDEKHFYIEVDGAYPCTIQFFDLYVNTTNE